MSSSEIVEKIVNILSDDQKNAVLSQFRYNRIIAGAGAGKTETLTRRIVYLLAAEKVEPASIVAFTFTEKAAQSMKSRVYKRVSEILGEAATAKLGKMYIGTIHAYAKRILEDHFRFGNYDVLDDNQEIAFLMRHGWGLGAHDFAGPFSEFCKVFLKTVNMVWDELLDEKRLREAAPKFFEHMKRYEEILREHKLLTFGHLIFEAVQRLQESQAELDEVKHLIVDEYQDINRAQAELIKLVGKNASIFVVGDPRQSIYQWRGSDEEFFDHFSDTFPDTREFSIRENRRSGKKIVCNANVFAQSFSAMQYEQMAATRAEAGFVAVACLDDAEAEARWVADQIESQMRTNSELKFSDFGVLTRSVGTSAGPLLKELRDRRIPYIVGGKVGLFKRPEAQALGRIFAWFSDDGFWDEDPYSRGSRIKGDILLASGLKKWDEAHGHGHPEDAEERLQQIRHDFHSAKPSYRSFTRVYYDVLTALGYQKLDFTDCNDAAVMANLGRFNNLLTDYEFANRVGGRTPKWERDLRNLCWFMASYALTAYEEQPSDDIRGVDAVQVMTVHQAKGLEWPMVFLFATIGTRFPTHKVGSKQNWCGVPRDQDLFDAKRYEGDVDDERRLFYVAITRAKDALVVSYFKRINRAVKPSPFVEDMDRGVIEELADGGIVPQLSLQTSKASEDIETFSASEIVTYNICPRMYLLRQLWGYQPELDEAIGYGNGLHFCLRRAGELVKEDVDPVKAVLDSMPDFHMPFVGGDVLERYRESAGSRLVKFAQKYGDDLKKVDEVEYRLEFPIKNATIMGKVDVILKDGGKLEVRDYKTSQESRRFEEIATQVRLYTSGLKSMGRDVTRGSVAYLKEPDVRPVDVCDKLLLSEKEHAEKTVGGIMDGQFSPNPGKNCGRCDQRYICKWNAASKSKNRSRGKST